MNTFSATEETWVDQEDEKTHTQKKTEQAWNSASDKEEEDDDIK